MSLFTKMSKSGQSYGVVPGNGGPKADDKMMIAGAGHVVPAENAHVAKKIVSALGYDPNVKVDMNQGSKTPGPSVPIKISSKEYFLNDQQVEEMKTIGIDPEMLSPNSDYNQRVNGGTTKQVEDMANSKLFGLMNNQNPAYQNGGDVASTSNEPIGVDKSQIGYRAPLDGSTMKPQLQAGTPLLKNKYGDVNYFAEGYNNTRQNMETAYAENPYYSDAEGNLIERSIDPDNLSSMNLYTSMHDSAKQARIMNRNIRRKDLGYQKIQRDAFYNPDGSKQAVVPTFQNGGGIPTDGIDPNAPASVDPVLLTSGFPREFQSMLHKSVYGNQSNDETIRWAANTANTEWPKYLAGNSQYQYLNIDPQIVSRWQAPQQPAEIADEISTLPTREITRLNVQTPAIPLSTVSNGQNVATVANNPNASSGAVQTTPQGTPAGTMSPEDKYVQDLIKQSEDLENQEVAANAAMGLWNMSRERQPMPEPVYMNPSLIRRDYTSYENDMSSDIERAERRGNYQAKQLGMGPVAAVGMAANSQEAIRKGNRSIWDMQQQDIAHNVGVENQAKNSYSNLKLQRDMADSQASQAFSQQKGQAMADNVREIFGAKEAGLYRTGELKGVAVNRQMDQLDRDYNSLNKDKMLRTNTGYISRDKYYKMTDEERKQLHEKLK